MLRLFVAVDLPAPLKDEVAHLMNAELHQVRWVRPPQLHITIRFLGDTSEDELPGLKARLAEVSATGFVLRLQGLGVFPSRPAGEPRAPKVLWLGVEPARALVALEHAVSSALSGGAAGVGMQPRPREYWPHLTLARFIGPPDHTLADFLTQNSGYGSLPWQPTSFHLYRSVLDKAGAIHTCLASYPFVAGPA